MDARLKAMAKKCRNRGGDCPCVGRCEAIRAIEVAIGAVVAEERRLQRERETMENAIRRLNTPPAKLKEGFQFDPRYQPVMVFDCGDAYFGYEDENGEWIDCEDWPFDPSVETIWQDDCERHGIRVE